jgi:hypothetical protein
MKRSIIKALVIKAQIALAERDFALGVPPQKTSKSYVEAYGRAYELAEKRSNETKWVTI